MSKKILINGAFGRMGQLACTTIEKHPEFIIVAKIGRNDNLDQAVAAHQPDVVIDFTNAECVWTNAQILMHHRAHIIIGTSGLKKEQINLLIHQSKEKKQGGLIVPNFSIGAALQMRCAAQVAQYFHKAEIIETHHEKKIDAPSATALATVASIQDIRDCQVPIHSIRLPGFVAQQEVIFGAEAETLSITHHVFSREAYIPGLLLACQKVTTFNQIHYGLEFCLKG